MPGADPSPASYGAHIRYIGQGTLLPQPGDASIRPSRYTARQQREGKPLTHVPNGWPHFRTSGDHQGNCMCLDRCCLGPNGCRCRGCKCIDHVGSVKVLRVGKNDGKKPRTGHRPAPDADRDAVPVPVQPGPPRRFPRL